MTAICTVYYIYLLIRLLNDPEGIKRIKESVASVSRFEQKMQKNEFYNLLDAFIDLIYAKKSISVIALLLTLFFVPMICVFAFMQYLFILFFLLWYCVNILVGFFSSEIIYYKNKINTDTVSFS